MYSGKSLISRTTLTIYKTTSLAIGEVLVVSKQTEKWCVCPDWNGDPQKVCFATRCFVAPF